jgi:hypothetical protein
MENLQKEIVDERRGQYIKTLDPATVGSMGTFGLKAGISPDLGSPTIVGSDPFPPPPIQHAINRQSRWTTIIGSQAGFVVGLVGFSSDFPIQGIQPPSVGNSVPSSFRNRELEWRRTHAIALRQYENQWVVLEGEEIVAHSSDAAQAIRQAKSRGIRTPYIFFVEPESDHSVRIGL